MRGEFNLNEKDRFVKFGHMSFANSTGGKMKYIHIGNGIIILKAKI